MNKTLTDYVFDKIMNLCERIDANFGLTKDHYVISNIKSIYTLKNVLDYLEIQKDYEVLVDTTRIDDILTYTVTGMKKNEGTTN